MPRTRYMKSMDTHTAIMDAAEHRIRVAGYDGFSFRTIAADIGVKSSSVHYHFATKDALAAAVTRRYQERVLAAVDERIGDGIPPVKAWKEVFRMALADGAQMCLCGALAATSGLLAEPVATEVRRFFAIGVEQLVDRGLPKAEAIRVLALLEGAILMASVQKDPGIFDIATSALAADLRASPPQLKAVTAISGVDGGHSIASQTTPDNKPWERNEPTAIVPNTANSLKD